MSSEQLLSIVERHAPDEAANETGIPGVQLYRISGPMPTAPAIYTPRICMNVRGAKRVYSQAGIHVYDESHCICCTMPVPVDADVPTAAPDEPVLGVSIELDLALLRELVVGISESQGWSSDDEPTANAPEGLTIGPVTDELTTAMRRLLELMGDTTSRHVLARSRLTEVYFVLLLGPLGSALKRRFGSSQKIADTACYIQDHIREPLSVEKLSKWAGMSVPSFHRNFKQATGLSPIQYIKQLRLNTAATELAAGMRAGEVAEEVGYNSQSQFTREFKRHFGHTPKEWASSAGV